MKIRSVKLREKRKVFEIKTFSRSYGFPFSKSSPSPTAENPIKKARVDKEIGSEGLEYELASGETGTIHIEQVLEYNNDPHFLRDHLLYKLTLEAQRGRRQPAFQARDHSPARHIRNAVLSAFGSS